MYEVVTTFTVDHKGAKGARPKSAEHRAGTTLAEDAIPKQSLPWLLEQGVVREVPGEPPPVVTTEPTGRHGRRVSGASEE